MGGRALVRSGVGPGIAVLAVGAGVAIAAGSARVGGSILAVLVGLAVWLGWDARRRLGDLAHMQRLAASRQKKQAQDWAAVMGGVGPRRTRESDSSLALDSRLERMERRLLAFAEAERVRAEAEWARAEEERGRAGARDEALAKGLAAVPGLLEASSTRVRDAVRRSEDHIVRAGWEATRDVEALLQVLPLVSTRALLPASGFWAMQPRNLAHLVDLVRRRRPATVLELGGGTSTIWLGYLLEETGGRLVSIDHDPDFAALTRAAAERHGLTQVVEVRVAPLVPVDPDQPDARWYDSALFGDVVDVDLLVIDGPPKATGPQARSHALPRLLPQMSRDFAVALDDAERPDEAAAVERWLDAVTGLRREDEGMSNLAVLVRSAGEP